ncbi:DUF6512 family protein [Clostridium sp.]|uniref:DUF6512 family protein n=1 Tax=Clostridium sp. TaxID=1506 RepID=UPI003216E7CE
MKNTCTFTTAKIFLNTIILGIVASFSHFAYNLSGRNLIVGLFNPINESVWEHLKFMFFPFLLWWIAIYLIKNKNCAIPLKTWIVSAAVSLVVAPLSVVLLFYSYTGALGIESVFIDILLVFVCYFIALCVASHFLKYSEPNKWAVIISVIVIAAIFIAFIVLTFNPPQLPIFYDTVTKTYGI